MATVEKVKTKRPISEAPPVTRFCFTLVSKEMLRDAILAVQQLGGFLERVEAEGSGAYYKLWYRHPEIEDRATSLLFTRHGMKVTIEIQDMGPAQ